MVANGHTLTDILRKAICMEKQRRPGLTQEALCRWMLEEHGVKVTQGTISNVLKRSADLLGPQKSDAALHSKLQRAVSYLLVEVALARWIIEYQGVVNISGHLIQEKRHLS
uniref:HTH CENPB-type domain-containing protein n=1 Tax=Hyaloperonospora arabidopsidis (strain Emoy2) TaxID=559515 RepID=M4BRK7_HYAAE